MAGPWEKFAAPQPGPPQPTAGEGPWTKFKPAEPDAPSKAYTGGILPFSIDENGRGSFDSNAGILGAAKRAVTLPGDVYSGKVDPMSQEATERAFDAASMVSPMNPAVRAGGHAVPGLKNGLVPSKVEPPSAQALKDAASKGYDRVRDSGVDYSTPSVTRTIGDIKSSLERDGILGELAPKTFSILSKFDNAPADSVVSIAGLEAARRAARHAAKDFNNPTDQMAAQRLIKGLDEFIEMGDPATVVAGPATAAAKELAAARGNYAAGARSEKLAGVEQRAELNAAASNSGRNTDNAVRQRARDIVTRPKEAAGFVESELAGLEDVIRGGPVRNGLRGVGNVLGGGGGLGMLASGAAGATVGSSSGATIGTLAALGLPVAGLAAKEAANRMSLAALGRVDSATRARSPLFLEMLGQAPLAPSNWAWTQSAGRLSELGAAANREPPTLTPEQRARYQQELLQILALGGA